MVYIRNPAEHYGIVSWADIIMIENTIIVVSPELLPRFRAWRLHTLSWVVPVQQ